MKSIKKEASIAGGIKGFQQGGPGMIRKRFDNKSQPFDEEIGDPISDPDLFECLVSACELVDKNISETVRKHGDKFIVYDDETDVAKGTYDDRETAWEKQRIQRQSKKNEKSVKEKNKTLESFINDVLGDVIKEGSMVSYVFENTPLSDESTTWENFISKLSKQTVMSDPKLNKILHYIAKVELNSLKKAAIQVKETLEGTGHFQVEVGRKIEQDVATTTPKLDFAVSMKDNNKKLKFSIRLDNGKPLFMWEQSKDVLNQMANEESKLLRAELVHIQETSFKQMNDIVSAIEKRDRYLQTLEQKFDKVLAGIGPLEMAMLKSLLKEKYKAVH